MEVTLSKKESRLLDTAETFSNVQSVVDETRPIRPPSRGLLGVDGLASKMETKKSQFFYDGDLRSDTVKTPTFLSPQQAISTVSPIRYGQSDKVYSRVISSKVVRQPSPPQTIITHPQQIHLNRAIITKPLTTQLNTTTVVHPTTIIRNPTVSITPPPIIRIENVDKSQDEAQIQRLGTLNDFLSENYNVVFNRLREVEKERDGLKRPPLTEVRCVNEANLLKDMTLAIDRFYEHELQSGMAKLKAINTSIEKMTRWKQHMTVDRF